MAALAVESHHYAAGDNLAAGAGGGGLEGNTRIHRTSLKIEGHVPALEKGLEVGPPPPASPRQWY